MSISIQQKAAETFAGKWKDKTTQRHTTFLLTISYYVGCTLL